MPDYDQLARNLAYGAIHRPAQLARWMGKFLLAYPATPLGQAVIDAANEVDSTAYEQLRPYVPPLPLLTIPPPNIPAIGRISGCLGYDPEIAPQGLLLQYEAEYPHLRFQVQWHWHGWWGCWMLYRTA